MLVAVALAHGCSTSGTSVVGGSAASQQTASVVADSFQINDISLPPGARLDASNTLMIGSGERWFGKVAIKADASPVQVFNHFQKGMPALGWRPVSVVQSHTSLMIFQRGERIALVQIEPLQLGGASVVVNVSIQEQGQPGQASIAR